MSSFKNDWMVVDEAEVFRLKSLLHDNILRVEKENLEIVRGILTESNTAKKRITDDVSSKTSLQTAVQSHVKADKEKSIHQRKLKSDDIGKNDTSKKKLRNSSVNSTAKTEPAKSHVKGKGLHSSHSYIEFLNDFHASLLSAKLKNRVLPSDAKCEYAPCAVPLAPPEQKMSLKITCSSFQNVSYEQVKFKDTERKNLCVQALPSITIKSREDCHNYVNFRLEEINTESTFKNKMPANSTHIKTTFFPIQNQNKVVHIPKQSSPSMLIENQSNLKDSGTQANLDSSAIPEPFLQEHKIKQLFAEALQEFEKCYSYKKESDKYLHQGNGDASRAQCNETAPPDFSSLNRNAASHEKNIIKSSSSQTTFNNAAENPFVVHQNELRSIIKEGLIDSISYLEKYIIPAVADSSAFEKGCLSCSTSVQTSESMVNVRNHSCSKAVQVSIATEQPDKIHPTEETANNYISDASALNEREVPPEASTNSELILKSIYEHICKEKRNTSASEQILESRSVLTRDVAVQFNPLQTCNKGTSTIETRTVDAFSQCETTPETITKPTRDASVQSSRDVLQPVLSSKLVDSWTQMESQEIVAVNASIQTADLLGLIPASEQSGANASVSSTPLSESVFIDDLLSEGEIPWNLRLLQFRDKNSLDNTVLPDEQESRTGKEKTALSDGEVPFKPFPGRLDFNSSITDETSDMSGKEKDYSLSEGEVHPKFFDHEESDISDHCKDENKFQNFQSQEARMPSRLLSYSMSEIELSSTNTSSSQGEVSPSNEINYYSRKFPVIKSPVDDKLSTILSYAKSFMQIDDHKANLDPKTLKRSERPENDPTHERKDPTSVPSTSRTMLQTVEEEASSNASL